jgi:diacylglycerol kinase
MNKQPLLFKTPPSFNRLLIVLIVGLAVNMVILNIRIEALVDHIQFLTTRLPK